MSLPNMMNLKKFSTVIKIVSSNYKTIRKQPSANASWTCALPKGFIAYLIFNTIKKLALGSLWTIKSCQKNTPFDNAKPSAFGVSWKGLISLATRLRNSFRSLTTIYNLILGSLWTIKSCQKEQATYGNYRMISIDCCSSCFLSNYPLLIISLNYTRHHGCFSSRKIDCYKDFENRNNLLR